MLDELGAEEPEMSNRPAEGCQAKSQKEPKNLMPRSPLL
jgi:hypothetical protein